MVNQKKILTPCLLFIFLFSFAEKKNLFFSDFQQPVKKWRVNKVHSNLNPLASFSPEWNAAKFKNLNTAKDVSYFSQEEKDVIWILNQVRHSPKLFLNTVLLNPKSKYYIAPSKRNYYYSSLVRELKNAPSILESLIANEKAFESAKCHAVESGKIGYVGHDRINNCQSNFYGECCQYGYTDPMQIVLALLIDNNVPSLGHRKICLSPDYKSVGVSIQPHTTYLYNAVIDFLY